MQIAVPIYDGFAALDAIGPYDVLCRIPGAEVVFCAEEAGPKRTENGMVAITADRPLREIDSPDVVVVPGGYGNRRLLGGSEYVTWLRDVHERTQWTTSVCTGSLLLAAAGILDDVDAATHWAARETLAGLGARGIAYLDSRSKAPGPLANDRVLIIPKESGVTEIADLLQREGLIEHPWAFKVAAFTSGKAASLKAGEYLFKARASQKGILDDIDAATHWAARETLAGLGARPVAERVVERGKVMTAAGVSAGIDMALTLTARMTAPEVAQAIQLGIEYDPDPPFDTGSVEKASDDLVALVRAAMDAEDRRTEEILAA